MKKLIFTSVLCAIFGNCLAQYTIFSNKNAIIDNEYKTDVFSLGECGDSFIIYRQFGTSASQKECRKNL